MIKEIKDKKLWEEFIRKYSPQSFFQSWNWGETITKITNSNLQIPKKLWRMGLFDNEKLVGIFQINRVEAKKGRFLHIRHGPIFISWERKYFDEFLLFIKTLVQDQKAIYTRISPLIENSDKNKQFLNKYGFIHAPIHSMDGEICHILDLNKNEDELLTEMRKTTRYLIRQSQKIGVIIKKSTDKKHLKDFLKLYNLTSKRHGFVRHQGIEEEFEIFNKDNQIQLFKAFYHEKLLSASLFVYYQNQAIYHHSASIDQKIPASYLLQWEAIKEAKKRGLKIYNFWGVTKDENNKKHPWYGLSLFKRGFGGRQVEYLHTHDLPRSILYCATYITESYRKFVKGY